MKLVTVEFVPYVSFIPDTLIKPNPNHNYIALDSKYKDTAVTHKSYEKHKPSIVKTGVRGK